MGSKATKKRRREYISITAIDQTRKEAHLVPRRCAKCAVNFWTDDRFMDRCNKCQAALEALKKRALQSVKAKRREHDREING